MALTQVDKPYSYTRKGQRLYIVYTSNNSAYTGFKFGFELTELATGKTYQVFISPDLQGRGVFDMSPLVNLRHQEEPIPGFEIHADTCYEVDGNGFKTYDIEITEWWIDNDVFTRNTSEGSATDTITNMVVTNSYFQPYQGYKPDTISLPNSCNYSWEVPMNFIWTTDLDTTGWYAYSDRLTTTSRWNNGANIAFTNTLPFLIYIACRWDDLGCLTFSTSTALTGNELDRVEFYFYTSANVLISSPQVLLNADEPLVHVAAYPGSITVPANCDYYLVVPRNSSDDRAGAVYVFYNEQTMGNWNQNCNYTPVRLAWVNSRGGWDYWNFQLKSERTTQIERKQYNSVLKTDFDYGFAGGDQPFYAGTRMLTDRSNLNTTSLLVTSDWLSEGEFTFLRSLLTSNQVQIIENQDYENTGCYRVTPVSIEQTSFVEKKSNEGKLHNLTLNLKFSQPYWGL